MSSVKMNCIVTCLEGDGPGDKDVAVDVMTTLRLCSPEIRAFSKLVATPGAASVHGRDRLSMLLVFTIGGLRTMVGCWDAPRKGRV